MILKKKLFLLNDLYGCVLKCIQMCVSLCHTVLSVRAREMIQVTHGHYGNILYDIRL